MKLKNVIPFLTTLLILFLASCNKNGDIALSPKVITMDPMHNAKGVAKNKVVSITFNQPMDSSTITSSTFTLQQGSTAIAGTVAYAGNTATFTPSNILSVGTVYTATLSTGAKNIAGYTITANIVWSFTTLSAPSNLAVNLGTAGNYVILAQTAINNNATSVVFGDLGLSPAATSYATGFGLSDATGYATSSLVTGKLFAADMAEPTPTILTTAVGNMITAYNDAAGRPTPDFSEMGSGNIGGKTLLPGLYKWTTDVTLPTDVIIYGGAADVWIFQIAGNLTLGSAVRITMVGGAQAKNIFWQVAGQATLDTGSHFEGNILSMTAITLQSEASINGRALAQTSVSLDGNTVVMPQ